MGVGMSEVSSLYTFYCKHTRVLSRSLIRWVINLNISSFVKRLGKPIDIPFGMGEVWETIHCSILGSI